MNTILNQDNTQRSCTYVVAIRDTSRKNWLNGNAQWREIGRVTIVGTSCLASAECMAVEQGIVPERSDFYKTGCQYMVQFEDWWRRSCVEYHNRVDLKMKDWRDELQELRDSQETEDEEDNA